MDRQIPARVWVTFLVAPIVALLVFIGCLAAWVTGTGEPAGPPLAGAAHASFFFAFFGLPIAFLVEYVVALPLFFTFRDRGWLRPLPVAAVAAVVGAVVMPLVWQLFWGGMLAWEMVLIGAVMGGSAGGVFAGLSRGRSVSRPAS